MCWGLLSFKNALTGLAVQTRVPVAQEVAGSSPVNPANMTLLLLVFTSLPSRLQSLHGALDLQATVPLDVLRIS